MALSKLRRAPVLELESHSKFPGYSESFNHEELLNLAGVYRASQGFS